MPAVPDSLFSGGDYSDVNQHSVPADAGGRFRIIREIARGGLGVIYLAEDGELQREVALKQIRADRADQIKYRDKFFQEALITGQLEHPGIVPVYAKGRDEAGRPFYVMRLVRGQSIAERIGEFHTTSNARAAFYTPAFFALLRSYIEVCQAVGYAHEQGVIHRDLKPSNVMTGSHGETLLLDWGLSKPFGFPSAAPRDGQASANSESPSVQIDGSGSAPTRQGSFVGTIHYASPEQLRGEVSELGPASDIYSLGIMLTEVLTGRPLLGKVSSVGEALSQFESGLLPRVDSLHRHVPAGLAAIAEKALAPRATDRYRSADALASDVEAWLTGEPISSFREPIADRAFRWIKRNRVAAAIASTLVLASILALLVAVPILNNARTAAESARAVSQFSESRAIRAEQEAKEAFLESERNAAGLERMVAYGAISNAFRFLGEHRPDEARDELDRVRGAVNSDYEKTLPWRLIERQGNVPVTTLHEPEQGRCLDVRWSQDGTRLFGLIETVCVGGDGLMLKTWNWPSGRLVSSNLIVDHQVPYANLIGDASGVIAMTQDKGVELFRLTEETFNVVELEFDAKSQQDHFWVSPSSKFIAWHSHQLTNREDGSQDHYDQIVVIVNASSGKLLLKERGISPVFVGGSQYETLAYHDDVAKCVKLVGFRGEKLGGTRPMAYAEFPIHPETVGSGTWLICNDIGSRFIQPAGSSLRLSRRHPIHRSRWTQLFMKHDRDVRFLCWLDDAHSFSVAYDDRLEIHDFLSGKRLRTYPVKVSGTPKPSPSSRYIAFSNDRGCINVLERFRPGGSAICFPIRPNSGRPDLGVHSYRKGIYHDATDGRFITHAAVSADEKTAALASGNIVAKVDLQTGSLVGEPLILDRSIGKLFPDDAPGAFRLQCYQGLAVSNDAVTWTAFSWDGSGLDLSSMEREPRSDQKGGPIIKSLGFRDRVGNTQAVSADQGWRLIGEEGEVELYNTQSGDRALAKELLVGRVSTPSGNFIGIGRETDSLYFVDGLAFQWISPRRRADRIGIAESRPSASATRAALSMAESREDFVKTINAISSTPANESWISKTWDQHVLGEAKGVLAEFLFVGMTIDDFFILLADENRLKSGVRDAVLELLKQREVDERKFAEAWKVLCDSQRETDDYIKASQSVEALFSAGRIDGVRKRVASALASHRLGNSQLCYASLNPYANRRDWKHAIESLVRALSEAKDTPNAMAAGLVKSFDGASEDQRRRLGSQLPLFDELLDRYSNQ